MRRIPGLVVVLFKNWLRSREAVFFSVLFPVVLLVIFSLVFAGGSAEFTIYVQNNDLGPDGDPTNLSAAFVDSLEANDVLTVRTIPADRNVTAWSRANRSTGTKRVLVIPDGFADRVRNASARARQAVILDTLNRTGGQANGTPPGGGNGTPGGPGGQGNGTGPGGALTGTNATANGSAQAEVLFLTASDDQTAPAVRGIIESHVARFNDRAIGVDEPPARVATGDLGSENLGAVDYYLPAFIATIVVINGVITVTSEVAAFNDDGTLKRLVATPLRKYEWIVANVVQQSILALGLTGVMVLVARLLFGVTAVPGPLSIALVLVGAVAFSALGMTLGGVLSDPDAATSLGNAIAFPMMFLSGVFWELELMPDYLQTVARLMPLYHFHRGLRRLMILDSTDGVWLAFAVLGGGAVVFLALAVATTTWHDFDD